MRLAALVVALGAFALGSTSTGIGSVWITSDPVRPLLQVDSKGNAVVSWSRGGVKQTVVVPPRGQLYHGGSLAGPDVSRPARVPRLRLARTTRRTPDGRYWALQAWHVKAGGPIEIHLARWRGTPTTLTLAFDGTRLTGRASFQGKPLTGTTLTLEGKRMRIYVFLDCFACPQAASGWARMLGVAPKADGTFLVLVRPSWRGTRSLGKRAAFP